MYIAICLHIHEDGVQPPLLPIEFPVLSMPISLRRSSLEYMLCLLCLVLCFYSSQRPAHSTHYLRPGDAFLITGGIYVHIEL